MPAIVGLLVVDLYIPDARTLKDKRRAVKSLLDRLTNRHNIAVAEVDQLDKHSRATIAIACVANERAHVESILSHLDDLVSRQRETVVEASFTEVF